MREFELLPDEEAIKKMAMEYSRIKARKNVLATAETPSEVKDEPAKAAGRMPFIPRERKCRSLPGFFWPVMPFNPVLPIEGPCVSPSKELEKIYYLEVDLLTAIECLLERNLNTATREYLKELIVIKRDNIEIIHRMYNRICGCGITYSPRLYCNGNFCFVLREVSRLQAEIMILIPRAGRGLPPAYCAELSYVERCEFAASTLIGYLAVYCKY